MDAIILAAGLGSRLKDKTEDRPKALVEVNEKPLIAYALQGLKTFDASKVTVVTGYMSELFTEHLHSYAPEVETVFNALYRLGSIITLLTALEQATDDVLIMNVDHIYPAKLFKRILQAPRKNITAMCDFDRTLVEDDMKVKCDEMGNLAAIHKQLSDFDGGYIGMTYCPKDKLALYTQAAHEALQCFGEMAPVEWILGLLAENGNTISLCDTSGISWLEVDNQSDLEHAEESLRTNKLFLL